MPLRDLLVHVGEARRAEPVTRFAAGLAAAHGAHLAALYLYGPPAVPAYIEAQLPPEGLALMRETLVEKERAAHAVFEAAIRRNALEGEWRAVESLDPAVAALHGRYVDLNVVGQAGPDADAIAYDLPEEIVLASGRPLVVVPYAGRFDTVGRTVLIAWNASREAARAVNDALPMIAPDARVTVLALNPDSTPVGRQGVPGAGIALHLARHDVRVEASHFVSDDISIGDMILSRAADLGADLIVMGAYGRSRLRERVLGGATRHILQHMTVPVLMSH